MEIRKIIPITKSKNINLLDTTVANAKWTEYAPYINITYFSWATTTTWTVFTQYYMLGYGLQCLVAGRYTVTFTGDPNTSSSIMGQMLSVIDGNNYLTNQLYFSKGSITQTYDYTVGSYINFACNGGNNTATGTITITTPT